MVRDESVLTIFDSIGALVDQIASDMRATRHALTPRFI